jgi:uncharacterized membrane protein
MPKDKILHVIAGAIIALSTVVLGWWAMGLVILAGAGKELFYDKMLGRGTFDILDAVATIAGGMVVTIFIQAIRGG